jgi:hypothetical protein
MEQLLKPQETAQLPDAYETRLYTATFLTKIDGLFFIVDCWHHRIIYADDLSLPIDRWSLLDKEIAGPHSITSDGELYVAEDTGRHRLFVYKKTAVGFVKTQIIEDVGVRPHRVLYDAQARLFFTIGSFDQLITVFKNEGGDLVKLHQQKLSLPGEHYTRSMTLFNGVLYIVEESSLLMSEYIEGKIEILKTVQLPFTYTKANDLFFLKDGSGYLSCTPKQLYHFKSFDDVVAGNFSDLSRIVKGTPYYIELIDGQLVIPEITKYSRILIYENPSDLTRGGTALFDFGPPTKESIERKEELPV